MKNQKENYTKELEEYESKYGKLEPGEREKAQRSR